MRIFLIALICCYTISAHSQKATYEKLLADLDLMVPAQLKQWNVAGVAIGVVHKDKLVYAKGYGYRDFEKKLPVTTETFFMIGSNTKAFTATVIGILAEKHNKNYLDAPVREILPQFQLKDEFANSRVTPRDMMSHRTGLPRGDWFNYGVANNSDSLYMRLAGLEPQAPFRTQYIYNNYMFNVLGNISEKLSGKKWEQNVKELIFDPLSMSNSGATSVEWHKNENRSKSYTARGDSMIPIMKDSAVFPAMPAGSILSNIPELMKWLTTWIYAGKYQGKQVIPTAYYQQALSAHNNILPSFDPERPELQLNSYGLGFDLMSYRGHYLVYHGGRVNGFTSNLGFMPQDSLGVIVLINQNSSPLYYNLMYSIFDRLLKLPKVDWNNREFEKRKKDTENLALGFKQDSSERITGTQPSLLLKHYTGTYFNAGIGYIRVITENGKLAAYLNRGVKIPLEHFHHNVFKTVNSLEGILPRKLNFSLNRKGKVDNLIYLDTSTGIEYIFNRNN